MASNREAKGKNHRNPSCEPTKVFEDITDLFRKIKKERGRSLFVLRADSIESDICDEVYRWRKELKKAATDGGLDILIHSPGGNLTQCYITARLFSRCVDEWEALVPEYATSGATLICLGSSKIIMSEISQLGPLDPQVISKRGEKFFAGERQSPLEAFTATRYLRDFSLASVDGAMEFLLQAGVNPQLALETATRLAIQLVEPILGKIEPYDLGAFALDSRVAIDYCKRIGKPANGAKKTQRKVDTRTLVETYPAHEFVIDLEEAKALKFNVSEPAPEIDLLFDQLRPLLSNTNKYIGLIETA